MDPAEVSKIFRVRWSAALDTRRLAQQIDALVNVAQHGRFRETISHLHQVVPTFSPAEKPQNVHAPVSPAEMPAVRRRPAKALPVLPIPVVAPIGVSKSLRQA